MSNLRRHFRLGDTVFVTVVTQNRVPILAEYPDLLNTALSSQAEKTDTVIVAQTILPDHFHAILRSEATTPSAFLQRVKMSFGATYRKHSGLSSGRAWQHRFYDHIIRNQQDLNTHIDYVHYNAVRHGYVEDPRDWESSSIHWPMFRDLYPRDWGIRDEPKFSGEFGE